MECSGEVLCDHSNFEELYIICAADNQSAGGVRGELHRDSFFRAPEMEMQCEASNRQPALNGTRTCQGLQEQLDNWPGVGNEGSITVDMGTNWRPQAWSRV